MDPAHIVELLEEVRAGRASVGEAMDRLRDLPYADLDFAKVDHHRALRTGFPEVVLGAGKTPQQVADIAVEIVSSADRLLVTRAAPEAYSLVRRRLADAVYLEGQPFAMLAHSDFHVHKQDRQFDYAPGVFNQTLVGVPENDRSPESIFAGLRAGRS